MTRKKEENKRRSSRSGFFLIAAPNSSPRWTVQCTQWPIVQFRQLASKQQERGEAVIHVFMQPNKTQFRTNNPNNIYRRQDI